MSIWFVYIKRVSFAREDLKKEATTYHSIVLKLTSNQFKAYTVSK